MLFHCKRILSCGYLQHLATNKSSHFQWLFLPFYLDMLLLHPYSIMQIVLTTCTWYIQETINGTILGALFGGLLLGVILTTVVLGIIYSRFHTHVKKRSVISIRIFNVVCYVFCIWLIYLRFTSFLKRRTQRYIHWQW